MSVLVLAGTSEARTVLHKLKEHDVIASLAGATRAPVDLGVETRVGGFGGVKGFRDYLETNGISAVLDATHPFAAQMTRTAAQVCFDLKLPHAILQRPAWEPSSKDNWHFVERIADTATLIPQAATVFLGTGRQTLAEFECIDRCRLLARVIDAPTGKFPFANGAFLVGKPPFSIAEEVDLFMREGIDWLVVKNSGGDMSRSKLDAAAELGLPVVMINRPEPPKAHVFQAVEPALEWVKEYL